MIHRHVFVRFAASAAIALSLPLAVQGQPFTFEKVVDNSGDFDLLHVPSMNDAGQIAFHGTVGNVAGLYTIELGEQPELVIDTTGDLTNFDLFPQINNAGTVVAWGETEDAETGAEHERIFTGAADGTITTVADTAEGPFRQLRPGPTISGDGTVAFQGTEGTGEGIHTRQTPASHVTLEDEADGFDLFFAPFINHDGDTAYLAREADGGPQSVVNYRADGTRIEILDNTGTYSGILPYSAPNRHGEVAIRGVRDDDGEHVILKGDGDTLTVLAEAGDTFASITSDLAINNNGFVVFNPRVPGDDPADPNPLALYFHDGDDIERIIGPGDDLFGSTVSDVFFTHGLNETDEVAFLYLLENEEVGIAVTQIPEPGTAGLLGLAALSLFYRRRREARTHANSS